MSEEKEGGVEPDSDSVVMDEEIDPDYVPGEEEVVEYAQWLGMDLVKDKDLFWIAREGLLAPLPKNWKPCKTKATEEIYYFNFLSGDSSWDHPCDGYYKRLYEEEKKKKEVNLKESADTKRAKAKQDVQDLLGKDKETTKKAKKSKKKNSLGAIGGGGDSDSSSAPRGLGGISSLGGGGKPLPNLLGKSLDKAPLGMSMGGKGLSKAPLGGLKGVGVASSLDSLSGSKNALSKKKSLKNTPTPAEEKKSTADGLEDSDSDMSLQQEQKQEPQRQDPESIDLQINKSKDLSQPQRSQSPVKLNTKSGGKSRSRLQSALSSEEFSRGSLEHAEEKTDGKHAADSSRQDCVEVEEASPDAKQVSSYYAQLGMGVDSPLPVPGIKKKLNFGGVEMKTDEIDFVKHQYDSYNEGGGVSGNDKMINASEGDHGALQSERDDLNRQKLKLKEDQADLKRERDMLERERTLLDKEKSVFSTERASLRREKSEAEDMKEALARDKEAHQYQKEKDRMAMRSRVSSPSPSDGRSSGKGEDSPLEGEVRRLERELATLQGDLDDLRREKNATAADLVKIEKSLESEKKLRLATVREAGESSSASHKEIEESLAKIALLEVDKRSLEGHVEQLKKNVSVLKEEQKDADDEIGRLKRSLAQSSSCSAASDSDDSAAMQLLKDSLAKVNDALSKKTDLSVVLKNTISELEEKVRAAAEETERVQVKLKFSTSENIHLEEELAGVQSEKRSLHNQHEDSLDDLARLKRESSAAKRREQDQADEISNLRPLSQRVRELEADLDAEKSKTLRAISDHESGLEDLRRSKQRATELQMQVEELELTAAEESKRQRLKEAGDRNCAEDVSSLSDQVEELKAKLMAANSARVDQVSLLDETEDKYKAAQKKSDHFQSQVGRLERQVSMMSSSGASSPAPLSRSSSPETLQSTALVAEWQGKVSRVESRVQVVEEDKAALESRLQISKKRVNELQEQVDLLEGDLAGVRSKLRSKTSSEEELTETTQRLSREVQEGKEKLHVAKEQLEQAEDTQQEARKAMRRLTEENSSLEAEKAAHALAKQRLESSHRDQVRTLEENISKLQLSVKSTEDSKAAPVASTADSISEIGEEVNNSCSDSDNELAKALADLRSSKALLDQEQCESREYQQKVEQLSRQLRSKELELIAATSLLEQKSESLTVGQSDSSPSMSTEIIPTFAIEEIKKLKEELYTERKQSNVRRSELTDVEFRLRRSEQNAEELRRESDEGMTALQEKVRQYQDEILELEQRLRAAEGAVAVASRHSVSVGDSPQEQRKEREKAEAVKEMEEERQQQMKQLQSTIEDLHGEKASLHQQVHSLKNGQLLLENKIEEAEFQAKIVQQTLLNSNQRCESYEADVDRMKSERHQLLAQAAEQSHTVTDLRSRLSAAVADKGTAQSSTEAQSTELYRLRDEIRTLQSQLSVAEQRCSDSQREINAMKESNRLQAVAQVSSGAGVSTSFSDVSPPVTASMDEMRIRELRLENERLAVEVSQRSSDLAAAKRTILDLQQEVLGLRNHLSEAKNDLTALQEQFTLKQEEVLRLYDMNAKNNKAIQMLSSSDKSLASASNPSQPQVKHSDASSSTPSSGLKRVVAGHEEKISDLQAHRREWEEALSQQTSLVQRLQEKLQDTEHTLSYHIQAQQQQHLSERQFQKPTHRSPPASPPFANKREQALGSTRPLKSSRGGGLQPHYMSSLRGFSSHLDQLDGVYSQQLPPGYATHTGGHITRGCEATEEMYNHDADREYGAEIDTRLQDLTFEQEEVSDEEGAGRPRSHSDALHHRSAGSSTSAISVLKQVLSDLIRSEGRMSSGRGALSHPRRKGESTQADDTAHWKQKIRKEKTLIFNVKKALKLENLYVKQVQDTLTKQRDDWKKKKEAVKEAARGSEEQGSGSGGVGSSSVISGQKEGLKKEGDRLNKRATQLNDLVHQIRRTQGWVVDREKKISQLENLTATSSDKDHITGGGGDADAKEHSSSSPSGMSVGADMDNHLEKMRRLEVELEADLTVLGGDISPIAGNTNESIPTPPAFGHHDFYENKEGGKRKEKDGEGKERQRLRFDASVGKGGGRGAEKQPRAHAGSGREGSVSTPLQSVSQHPQRHPQQAQFMYPQDYHNPPLPQQFFSHPPRHMHDPHHYSHSYQPQAPPAHLQPQPYHSALVSGVPAPPPPPAFSAPASVGVTANHFAERFDKSAHHLNTIEFQAQSHVAQSNIENVPNMSTGSLVDSVKRGATTSGKPGGGIRTIVEHRAKSAEAAENHVSWLDSLRKEISQFPHSAAAAPSTTVRSQQPLAEVTSSASVGRGSYGAIQAVYRV